ncbi:MAG: glucose 1-dehydrogenase [Alphaproteobacteria bacterium]
MTARTVIVTGATSGIGAAAAKMFAARGDNVVAAGRRQDRGDALIEEIKAAGGAAVFVQADMAKADDIKAMVDRAVGTYGGLDYAFNNAGSGGEQQALHEYTDDNWDAVMAVNLTGVYRCMKYEVAAMLESGAKQQGGAVIVNCASTLGHRASVFSGTAYTASKHGVIGLSKQAAIDYVKQNIRVNVVSPGATRTELLQPAIEADPAMEEVFSALNPIGRMGTAEEVAAAALFLCSDAAAMITGHAIPVDGGCLAQL